MASDSNTSTVKFSVLSRPFQIPSQSGAKDRTLKQRKVSALSQALGRTMTPDGQQSSENEGHDISDGQSEPWSYFVEPRLIFRRSAKQPSLTSPGSRSSLPRQLAGDAKSAGNSGTPTVSASPSTQSKQNVAALNWKHHLASFVAKQTPSLITQPQINPALLAPSKNASTSSQKTIEQTSWSSSSAASVDKAPVPSTRNGGGNTVTPSSAGANTSSSASANVPSSVGANAPSSVGANSLSPSAGAAAAAADGHTIGSHTANHFNTAVSTVRSAISRLSYVLHSPQTQGVTASGVRSANAAYSKAADSSNAGIPVPQASALANGHLSPGKIDNRNSSKFALTATSPTLRGSQSARARKNFTSQQGSTSLFATTEKPSSKAPEKKQEPSNGVTPPNDVDKEVAVALARKKRTLRRQMQRRKKKQLRMQTQSRQMLNAHVANVLKKKQNNEKQCDAM